MTSSQIEDLCSKLYLTGARLNDLAPTGRELVVEASYALPLFGGDVVANSWWRRDPGHIAAMPDDKGAALRFTMGF